MQRLALAICFALSAVGSAQELNLDNSVQNQGQSLPSATPGSKMRMVFKVQRGDSTKSFTLRADLFKVNHFFVQDLHVETVPRNSGATSYELQVLVFKRFGENKRVEESIGSMEVKGRPVLGAGGLYTLGGSAQLEVSKLGQVETRYSVEPVEAESKDVATKQN